MPAAAPASATPKSTPRIKLPTPSFLARRKAKNKASPQLESTPGASPALESAPGSALPAQDVKSPTPDAASPLPSVSPSEPPGAKHPPTRLDLATAGDHGQAAEFESGALTERGTASTKGGFISKALHGMADEAKHAASMTAKGVKEIKHDVAVAGSAVTKKPMGILGSMAHKTADVAHDIGAGIAHKAEKVVDKAMKMEEKVEDALRSLYRDHDAFKDHECLTPEDRWFTPKLGWPQTVANEKRDKHGHILKKWVPPPPLLPTAKEVPCIYHGLEDGACGELRIEVLECKHLPVKDVLVRSTDPFVVVVFEGCAARTSVVGNTCNPKWSAQWPRAMRFPISNAYSHINVGVFDHDDDTEVFGNILAKVTTLGMVQDQSAAGRATIPLAAITAGSMYDVWLPLHLASDMLTLGKNGHIRLRFSVTFKSERSRLIDYPLGSPKTFVLPFLNRQALMQAKFAVKGFDADLNYSWDRLCVVPCASLPFPLTRATTSPPNLMPRVRDTHCPCLRLIILWDGARSDCAARRTSTRFRCTSSGSWERRRPSTALCSGAGRTHRSRS